MVKRLIAAIVALAILLPILVWGGEVGVDIVVLVAAMVCLDEYTRMTVPDRHGQAFLVMMFSVLGIAGFMLMQAWGLVLLFFGVGFFSAVLWSMMAIEDPAEATQTAAKLALGLLYVPFLLAFCGLVRRFDHGLAWIFLMLMVTWFGDTGAYFAGKSLGKHKLFERISPNKTIEGAVGGLLLAVVGAVAVKFVGLPNVAIWQAVVLGVVLDIMGVTGDLVESMLKRGAGVKDSGWIMPGHGGLLDRIDSLLFSAPAAFVCAHLMGLA